MNRIKAAVQLLKQIEEAVIEEFPDGGGPNGVRIDNVVRLLGSADLNTCLASIESEIARGNNQ